MNLIWHRKCSTGGTTILMDLVVNAVCKAAMRRLRIALILAVQVPVPRQPAGVIKTEDELQVALINCVLLLSAIFIIKKSKPCAPLLNYGFVVK